MTNTLWLILLVSFSIACSCASQVFQKFAANDMQHHTGSALQLLIKPNVLLSILFLGLGLISWLLIISEMELSVAYPLMSIGYIVMLVVSHYLFNETITSRRWVGTGFIILGVISLTGVNL